MRFAFISTMHGRPVGWKRGTLEPSRDSAKRAGHDVQASVAYWPRLSERSPMLGLTGRQRSKPTLRIDAGQATVSLEHGFRSSSRRSYGRLKRFNPDLVIISQGYISGGFDWAKGLPTRRRYLT